MKHGSSRYSNLKCRCAICRAGWAALMRRMKRDRLARGQCLDCSAKAQKGYVRCATHRERNRLSTRRRQAQLRAIAATRD